MRFRVKELAQQRGLTLDDLARMSGVKYSTAKNLWQGRTQDPNYSTLRAIAAALNVSVEDLEQPASGNEPNFDATPALLPIGA